MTAPVRSLLFALVFYGLTVPLALVAAVAALLSQRAVIRVSRLWGLWFLWCSEALLGVRLEVRGTVPQAGALVAIKHSSAFETLVLLALFERPATIMKIELLRIPVWGFVARRQGSIGIDRSAGGTALRAMLREARQAADAGRPIILFPEGTRVPHGSAPPLRAGLAALAAGLGLPVVPVAHDAGRLWPRGLVKRPGIVTMAFQEPIAPSGLGRDGLERAVHAAINRDPRSVALPVTRKARARRVPLAAALLPLLLFGIGWWWVWDGYRDRLVADLARVVPEGTGIASGGWPYRLEVRLAPVDARYRDVALEAALAAGAVTIHQVPWKPEVQVLTLDAPRGRISLPLAGLWLEVGGPAARASLRRDGSRIRRLSGVWDRAEIETGLIDAPIRAERFETHLRETPAPALDAGPASPRGPAQAALVLRGEDLRIGDGDPLRVLLESELTSARPITSLAGWARDGTVEVGRLTIADPHGEVAAAEATLVPAEGGRLRVAGTITTVCPASVRAALAAAPPVSELRLRRPVRFSVSGTLPGGLVPAPDAAPARPAAVRGQEPPCPRLR